MNKKIFHILAVDDDDRIRELVKEYLEENNFIVTSAKDALDAKKKLKILKFDILILDIMMPGKSGLSLTNEIKKINPQEKKILEKMLESPGKVFSRNDIGKIINISKERTIDVMITRLRQKIESYPKNPKYLQTIRGSGYVLWIK